MKGIIIAAGYGTRFLPASKTLPKEMFPLIDKPAIDFIIEEFILSGITEILIISSRRKKTLEDYFDREIELETVFKKEKAAAKLDKIKPHSANFYFMRQQEMKGTGQAILQCKNFTGNEPFIVAYPDDIVMSDIPLSKKMIDLYNKTGFNVLSGEIINGDVSRYGVIDYRKHNDILKVKGIVEKPAKGTEPSRMISIGRYLFTPEIMSLLEENYKKHKEGEFYHIDSILNLAQNGKVAACEIGGSRFDVGDKIGFIEAIIRYGLKRDDIKTELKKILKKYSD